MTRTLTSREEGRTSERLTVNLWLRRIARSRRLSPKARLVAHTIGLRMDWTTLEAWPSVELIAREAGLHPRTVQRATRELQHAGLLWVTRRGKRPSSESNVYRAVTPERLRDGDGDGEDSWAF